MSSEIRVSPQGENSPKEKRPPRLDCVYVLAQQPQLLVRVPGYAIPDDSGHNCDVNGCPSAGMHNVEWLTISVEQWERLKAYAEALR